MTLVTRQSMVDDSGNFTSGTIVDKAFVDQVYDQVDDQAHSTTNPTVKPKAITDEVVAARGVQANLDARLDAIETSVVSLPDSAALLSAIGQVNMAQNELFMIWPTSDTTAPSYWTIAGAGGTLARCGTGLADANKKIGDFCARVRRVAVQTLFYQRLLGSSDFSLVQDALRGAGVGLGAWVRSTSTNGSRLFIDDGVGRTYSSSNVAANTWEWLTVSRTLHASATELTIGVSNDVDGSDVYLSAPTFMFSEAGFEPDHWIPSAVVYTTYYFFITGNVTTGAGKFFWQPHRPGIVKDVQLIAGTAPTGADLIVDVNSWDGAAFASMFSARPLIAAGANRGGDQPDGTYERRCIGGGYGNSTTEIDGGAISIDVDQVGSGTAGANLGIMVRILHPASVWESVMVHNFIGI